MTLKRNFDLNSVFLRDNDEKIIRLNFDLVLIK